MRSLLDDAAEALRAGAPVFTRRNLFHACRRTRADGAAVTEVTFERALRRRLARGPLPGLLPVTPSRGSNRSRSPRRPFPDAILLVDRPAVADLLARLATLASPALAIVCIDGSPAPLIEALRRGFRAGRRAPVLYVHDAATVVYPFTLEPLATAVREGASGPQVYRDLGLPPLGAAARRFADPTLPADELVFELEAVPPATLLRYCTRTLRRPS
jgi:hypothetical protein